MPGDGPSTSSQVNSDGTSRLSSKLASVSNRAEPVGQKEENRGLAALGRHGQGSLQRPYATEGQDSCNHASGSEDHGGLRQPSSSSGQGSSMQPSSRATSQSSSGIGRFSSRAGHSPPPLHLRESISGLLKSEEHSVQVSSAPCEICNG